MRCPYCGEQNDKVIDSRPNRDNSAIRRRRACLNCEKRFTTYEYIEDFPVLVVKRDGRKEEFNREKIMQGLFTACRKRRVDLEKLEHIADTIHEELMRSSNREVSSTMIGEKILSLLKEVDHVAYIRFASVYRAFGDIGEFAEFIRSCSE